MRSGSSAELPRRNSPERLMEYLQPVGAERVPAGYWSGCYGNTIAAPIRNPEVQLRNP